LPRVKRYWLWGVTILILLGIWLLVLPDDKPEPAAEDEILILVSEFTRAGGDLGFNVAGRLEEGLQVAVEAQELEGVRVETYPEVIDSDELALGLLEEMNAALVVWGEYDSGRVVAQMFSRDLRGEVFPGEKNWVLDRSEALPATINLDLPLEVNWLALFAIGRSLQVQGMYPLAQKAYESALQYVQGNATREAQLYFYLGYAEASKADGDLDRTIAYYSEVLNRDPDHHSALNNRAVVYMNRNDYGDLERARADLERALELAPQDVTKYHNLGLVKVWLDEDNLEEAIDDFRTAAAIDPSSAKIQNALCWYLSLAREPEAALPHCDRSLALDPSGNHYDSRGLALALLGRYEEAAQDFQLALDLLEHQDPERYLAFVDSRSAWIDTLSGGASPFNDGILQSLFHE
jgi:tetratricopeptide (TPR) repeat protein